MGYQLNSLGNLPIDDDVKFYIFVINGQWQEPLYEMIQQNFSSIARSVGKDAAIVQGLNPVEWYGEIAEAYLGKDHNDYFSLLPALLVSNARPDNVHDETLRLLIPLRDVEGRFGGWPQFFSALSAFVQGRSDELIKRFDAKDDVFDAANKVMELRPGAFGIAVNLNELISIWRKRKAAPRSSLANPTRNRTSI